jgi:hypothetical protein
LTSPRLFLPMLCILLLAMAPACKDNSSSNLGLDATASTCPDPSSGDPFDAAASSSASPTIGDVDSIEMEWPLDVDAGHLLVDTVSVSRDGTARCWQDLNGVQVLAGALATPNPGFQALLSQPTMLPKLLGPCLLRVADVGPYVKTSLAAGSTVVTRLVWGSCSDDALTSLVDSLVSIGTACIEQAIANRRD